MDINIKHTQHWYLETGVIDSTWSLSVHNFTQSIVYNAN